MRPVSPYGVAKLAAHGLVGTMRARHGLHLSSAITYNHESVRRPERFLPRKVDPRRGRDRARRARTSWCSGTSARCATGATRATSSAACT